MESKQKLAYVTHGIAIGGAEIATLSALPTLLDHYDLRVYVLGKSDAGLLSRLDGRVAQRLVYWDFPSYLLPFYLPAVYLALARFRPDVVISSLWRSAGPAVLYRACHPGTKYFLMVHNTTFFHIADRLFTTWGMRRSDAIFADSTSTKRFAEQHAGTGKPISILSYLTAPTPESVTAAPFGGSVRFFSMCRLNPVKRVHLAVRVIAWLRGQGVDARLHVYGRDDGDEGRVRDEIQNLNLQESVVLRGEIRPDEKDSVYSNYNGYIQLSQYEGMAMSVVEAAQQGMLCVVTPAGEIPHYVRDNESAIFMRVSSGEVEEESLARLRDTLGNARQCREIAAAAHATFRGMPLFPGSLIDAIQNHSA